MAMADATALLHHRAATRPATAWWTRLGAQVAVALGLGILLGFVAPNAAVDMKVLGDLFISLVKIAVGPLVFLFVVSGIVGAGSFKRLGRIGLFAIGYFEIVSTLALVFGLLSAHLLRVGTGIADPALLAQAGPKIAAPAAGATSLGQVLTSIVPDNFVAAFTHAQLLQVLVLAILFGISLLYMPSDKQARSLAAINGLLDAFFAFINLIMRLAPIGTFGAAAYSVGTNGATVLLALGYLVLAFYVAVVAFVIVVLWPICLAFKIPLWHLLDHVKDEIVIVLGTASSESVLPRLLAKLEAYGASKQAVGLVLPTAYAFNVDGSSIFMTMAVIFIANAYGIDLSLRQEFGILAITLLTSKGLATVSGGTFVVLAATVATSGVLPLGGLALILGVYRFMSMAIAATNLVGNSVATIVIAKLAGEYEPPRLPVEAEA